MTVVYIVIVDHDIEIFNIKVNNNYSTNCQMTTMNAVIYTFTIQGVL